MATIPSGFHPFANLLPMMEKPDLKELAKDIEQHGLRHKIHTFQGKILDGRNRLKACTMAGVKPEFEEFTGSEDEALAFIRSQETRRHLTIGQRSMFAAEFAKASADVAERNKTKPSTTQRAEAKKLNVSRRSAQIASKVLREGTPEEIDDVRRGKKKLVSTAKQIDKRKQQASTKDQSLKDPNKVEIPERLRDLFGDNWLKIMLAESDRWISLVGAKKNVQLLRTKSKALSAYLKSGDAALMLGKALDLLINFREILKSGLPFCVCPKCQGDKGGCQSCRNSGWVPEWRANELKDK